jgi:predicted aspartyl protease
MRDRLLVSMAALFTLVNFSAPELSADSAADTLPFTLADTGQILIPVMVNSSGPYQFVLDTGANRSAISDTMAARLSLQPVAITEIVTSTGSAPTGSMTSVVRLQIISLGGHSASGVLTPVLKSERIHAVHAQADGIIGQDVLIDAHYTLDYRRTRVIWLGAGRDTGAGTRLALRRSEGRLIVELPQSSRPDSVALLVPDSGASMLVLFQQDGRTAVSAMALAAVARTTTVTGDGYMQVAVVPRLRIGRDTLWDQPAVLLPGPAAAGAHRLDGLLPLSLFSDVTFNGRENYMVVRR